MISSSSVFFFICQVDKYKVTSPSPLGLPATGQTGETEVLGGRTTGSVAMSQWSISMGTQWFSPVTAGL